MSFVQFYRSKIYYSSPSAANTSLTGQVEGYRHSRIRPQTELWYCKQDLFEGIFRDSCLSDKVHRDTRFKRWGAAFLNENQQEQLHLLCLYLRHGSYCHPLAQTTDRQIYQSRRSCSLKCCILFALIFHISRHKNSSWTTTLPRQIYGPLNISTLLCPSVRVSTLWVVIKFARDSSDNCCCSISILASSWSWWWPANHPTFWLLS